MSLYKAFDASTDALSLEVVSGKEDIHAGMFSPAVKMHFSPGIPGIVWFDRYRETEYEVLDYTWDGPRYQDVMIQDNETETRTRGGRKGRVVGALIGTAIAPGIGTLIGAAVGTGRKEQSHSSGYARSHIETQEIPVVAHMHLRNLSTDEIVLIGFKCTAALDTRIRNNVTVNLDADVIDYTEPIVIEQQHAPREIPMDTGDVLARIRELKQLLDDGAITQEEYDLLKKKLLQ